MLNKKLVFLLAAVLAIGLIEVGCGDDADNASETPAAVEETTTDDSADAPGDVDDPIQAAIEACKSNVEAVPRLSNEVKSELKEVCDEAGSGDPGAMAQATKDGCIRVAEETIPAGAARHQAIAICESVVSG